ncbi:hypothetical protein FKW77_001778 [Venturia effusa]|uniref:Uncharacterized protein n=1 Tax=Venturia effusa TaxID=50376 RepID=A0A517LNF2_9PEZI|nr:hypothetical protein FKW77_001778 [Venturia effusa]
MDYNNDQLTQEMAGRIESSNVTRRHSRPSCSQTPKRHSARIEKPRSGHHSPRASERRRTFTAVKQYASLDDHYRKMFGLEDEEEQEDHQEQYITTRPVSWHPSSSWCEMKDYTRAYPNTQTPMPLQQPTTTVDTSMGSFATQVDAAWSAYMHGETAPRSADQFCTTHSNTSSSSQPTPTYYSDEQLQCTPAQQATQSEQTWERESGDGFQREQSTELIGLGLYDPPGTILPFMHRDGKGLKLEETWQPPEEMEDADADEESEDEEEEPPRPEDAQLPQARLPMVNLSGQSYFFDEKAAGLKTEWWYHQLKNSVPQAGTLGYGWI